jgi:metal-responsive CopG/Arc/MetJ family transcriptional regulator
MPMARAQTMVQLTENLVERLDDRAARTGVSRSQLVREAVEEFLTADRKELIDQQIVDGYTRMPQVDEYDTDEWADLDKQLTALTAKQMQQLNREEREAGYGLW